MDPYGCNFWNLSGSDALLSLYAVNVYVSCYVMTYLLNCSY